MKIFKEIKNQKFINFSMKEQPIFKNRGGKLQVDYMKITKSGNIKYDVVLRHLQFSHTVQKLS